MSEATREEDVVRVGRETRTVHLLRVGLSFEDDALSQPVPHGDCEVGEATQGDKFVARGRVLDVGVAGFSAALEHAVELQSGILVDVNVRVISFLSHCEVLAIWVHSNGANAIPVLTMEGAVLLSLQVVGLVLVASHENDLVWVQKVDVVTLHRGHAQDSVEREVTLGDLGVDQLLGLVVLRVELIDGLLVGASGHFFVVDARLLD